MAAQAVTVDDFDGDGYQDLLTPQSLWRNGVDRFYALASTAPEQSTTLATGDFNGDGKADLATQENGSLRIRLNNGDGSFTALSPVPWSREIKSVAVADFNRDNKLDLFLTGVPAETIVPSGDSGGLVSVLFGDGTGKFTFSKRLGDFPPVWQVAAADLSGDGVPDLIFHSYYDIGNTLLYVNDGRGGFPDNLRVLLGHNFSQNDGGPFALGDFNGDQKVDVLRPPLFGRESIILLNDYPVFTEKRYVLGLKAAGDFDRDGRIDFTSNLGMHLSRCTAVPQKRLAVTSAASYATTIAPESIASIFGTNLAPATMAARTVPLPFELAGTSVQVEWSGRRSFARLLFVSPTQINFIVSEIQQLSFGPPPDTVRVLHANNEVSFGDTMIAGVAPGLFAANGNGQGIAAAQVLRVRGATQTYESIARFDATVNRFLPVPIDLSRTDEDVYLVLYGTGLPQPCRSNGQCFFDGMNLTAGGRTLPLSYVGRQGGFAGLDQINALLPRSLARTGLLNLIFLNGNNAPSNTVQIEIK